VVLVLASIESLLLRHSMEHSIALEHKQVVGESEEDVPHGKSGSTTVSSGSQAYLQWNGLVLAN
jgi:hypothetical protein